MESLKKSTARIAKSNLLLQQLLILKDRKNELKGWKITHYQTIKKLLHKIRFQERKATGNELNEIEKLITEIGKYGV